MVSRRQGRAHLVSTVDNSIDINQIEKLVDVLAEIIRKENNNEKINYSEQN